MTHSTLEAALESSDIVDLSHPLGADTVQWPGSPRMETRDVATFADDGYFARFVGVFEHAGTHFDAPSHMVEGGDDLHEVAASTLIVPVVCLDISERVETDSNASLQLVDVLAHEKRWGPVPAGSAVVLHTGWAGLDALATDDTANAQQSLSFPGFGVEASEYLVSDRGVVGLGIDSLGIDPGYAGDFPVHRHVSHPRGLWHLENLTQTAKLPPRGAVLFVGVCSVRGASGFPARVLALVPRQNS